MNTTNSTLDQARCVGQGQTPLLNYPNVCAINIWQRGMNLTDDPYGDLKSCCPTDAYSYYGPDDCFAYCNATTETFTRLEECLTQPLRFAAVMCNSGSAVGPARSLTAYLLLAVVFTGLWQL
ncbi:hypothetical protein HFD88_007756 [Aspergillus terreus]|nr:hypothetical protein HFD88_007756 [Aspergillus terreus]